jgi:hypothetical protein
MNIRNYNQQIKGKNKMKLKIWTAPHHYVFKYCVVQTYRDARFDTFVIQKLNKDNFFTC